MTKHLVKFLPLLALPILANAQSTLQGIFRWVASLFNALLPLIISLTLLFFAWGVLRYIRSGDNPEERANARSFMIYGIISLFVMVSIWGFVNLLDDTFYLDTTAPTMPNIPTMP